MICRGSEAGFQKTDCGSRKAEYRGCRCCSTFLVFCINATHEWNGLRSSVLVGDSAFQSHLRCDFGPFMSKISVTSSPNEWPVMPFVKTSGKIPMPRRLDLWMRSKLSAMTALTPKSLVPLAAQSRERCHIPCRPQSQGECLTLDSASRHHKWAESGHPKHSGATGACSISFLRRMLANVPRIITSWLPAIGVKVHRLNIIGKEIKTRRAVFLDASCG